MWKDSDLTHSPDQAYQYALSGKFATLKTGNYNIGFTTAAYWLLLEQPAYPDSLLLVLGNAHLNDIRFYEIVAEKPVLKYQTGDHYQFSKRPVPDPFFIFPLAPAPEPGVVTQYLIRIDKHNESLQLRVDLMTIPEFYTQLAKKNLINGVLSGMVLLLVIYGSFLFLTVKDPLYLFYVGYLLATCLWLLADQGYGYQYLWPDFPYFASRSRPVFNCLMNITALHFMQVFIEQNTEKRVFKIIKALKWTFLSLALLFLLPLSTLVYGKSVYFLLLLLLFLNVMSTFLMLWSVSERIKAGYKQAWFYLASIFPLLFFGILEVLVHAGVSKMPMAFLAGFGIQTALIIQTIILTFGLAYRFNSYRLDREQLLLAVNREQQEMTSRILESQETERRKISDQLHDDIGTTLSIANWQVNAVLSDEEALTEKAKMNLEKAAEALQMVSAKIRRLGHNLSPWAIQKYGLNKAVTDLAYQINVSEQLALEYAIFGFESCGHYPLSFLNEVYRIIQELVNNILKHAGARHAYLELIEHEDHISIIVEDNGKGIDDSLSMRSSGIGLENILGKIAHFHGQMEIKRKSEHGTIVVIRIPLP